MALDRDELKKPMNEKGLKSPNDSNAFIGEAGKEVVETLLEGEPADHLGFQRDDQKAKTADNVGTDYGIEAWFKPIGPFFKQLSQLRTYSLHNYGYR